MRLDDIIKRVQRQFGDDVEAQITQEDIVNWVNDACLEIVTKNMTNQANLVGYSDIIEGKSTYSLPPDLYKLRNVRANGKVIRGTTYDQLVSTYDGQLSDTTNPAVGEPEWYWVEGGKLNLVPQPNNTLGTLDIFYISRPDLMDVNMLTREPDVPTEYHPRIVEYCIAQAAELDDDSEKYQIKMSEFASNVNMLKQNGEQPESDSTYPSITYVSDWG